MQPVGVQWFGQLLADEVAHALAGDGAGKPRHQPAVGQRVIRRLAVQHAVHRRRREPRLHRLVIQQFGLAHAVELRQPGAVPHHLADGDVGLAVGAELRPVLGDGGVVVDQATVGQPVDDRRGHALGRRAHHRAGVGGPVLGAASVRVAGPDVDDGFAVQVDGQRAAAEPASGNSWEKARTVQAKFESAAPCMPCGSAALRSRLLTPVTMY